MDYTGETPMMRSAALSLFAMLMSCSNTRPLSPAEQSIVLARLPSDDAQDAIMTAVQKALQDHPGWAAKVASHGMGTAGVYDLSLDGTCAQEAAVVAEIQAIARRLGAIETSCVPASRFAPGEAIEFRR